MSFYILLPLYLGLVGVAQGILNRQVAADWGMSWTVFLNATFFLLVSILLVAGVRYAPEYFPDYLRPQNLSLDKFKWWFLVPGFCGFCLVLGIPWSIQLMGPSKTFIFIIVGQIIVGLLFEKFLFDLPLSFTKLAGAILVVAGATLVMLSPK